MSETSTMQPLEKGTVLQGGKYKIIRFISSGGFGCTYEAEHVMLEQRVAIKEFFVKDFCNRDEVTSHVTVGTVSKKGLVEKLRSKFIDEAKALCKLSHPGIVRVSDVFEENNTAYYVMDYVDGCSLSDVVKKQGAMPEVKALKYIREVADALAYVHGNNRLHLDIKPGNVMLDSHDHAILIDFGASKQYDEDGGENTSTLMGMTPGYAPIEQMGSDVMKFTPSTDIYALAATLYKLITGVTPLGANRLAGGEQLPPVSATISASTRHTLSVCIQTNRSKRAQSIEEFLKLLETPISEPEMPVAKTPHPDDEEETVMKMKEEEEEWTPEPPQKNTKKWLIPLCAGVAVVIAVVVGVALMEGEERVELTPIVEEEMVEPIGVQEVVGEDAKELAVSENVSNQKFTNRAGVSFTYSGVVNEDGEPHGFGVGVYEMGTYTGEYKQGLREGKGGFTFSQYNESMEGTFADDMIVNGRYNFEDGSYFEGTFENWQPLDGQVYDKQGKLVNAMKAGKAI